MNDDAPPFEALAWAMDHSSWTLRREGTGVSVSSARPVFGGGGEPSDVEGFLVAAEREDLSLAHGLAYFHDACHFADTANAMTTLREIVAVSDPRLDHYRAVVRTGFSLPWPLQDREFLHGVATRVDRDPQGRHRVLIAYWTVPETGLPPAWSGYLRCPMAPSGQRLTDLGDGRVRAEHCMTYDLGGRVPHWAQNRLFHRGHVGAYFDEWVAAMETLSGELAAGPALSRSRGPTENAMCNT